VNVAHHVFAGPPDASGQPPRIVAPSQDALDRLLQLEKVHARGILTDDDFHAMTARVMGG
jgi:hypothetical protein